jgi:fido (protein-threonine AMPylation protein)
MGTCPDWCDDAAERLTPAARHALWTATRAAAAATTKGTPDLAVVESWHDAAFAPVVPLRCYAGNVRQNHAKHLCLAQNVAVGPLPGSDFNVVPNDARQLFDWVSLQIRALEVTWSATSPTDRVKRLAGVVGVAVGWFVRIHPFVNGNGRTSRILWTALLARFGLPPQCSVLKRPAPPYDQIMASAMTGNYQPCVLEVLRALSLGPLPQNTLKAPSSSQP